MPHRRKISGDISQNCVYCANGLVFDPLRLQIWVHIGFRGKAQNEQILSLLCFEWKLLVQNRQIHDENHFVTRNMKAFQKARKKYFKQVSPLRELLAARRLNTLV